MKDVYYPFNYDNASELSERRTSQGKKASGTLGVDTFIFYQIFISRYIRNIPTDPRSPNVQINDISFKENVIMVKNINFILPIFDKIKYTKSSLFVKSEGRTLINFRLLHD